MISEAEANLFLGRFCIVLHEDGLDEFGKSRISQVKGKVLQVTSQALIIENFGKRCLVLYSDVHKIREVDSR